MLTSCRQATTDSALNVVESFVTDAAKSNIPKFGRCNPWLLAAEATVDIAAQIIGIAGLGGVKAAFNNLFGNDNVKVSGSSYLSDGCHVTVNGCAACVDRGAVLLAA